MRRILIDKVVEARANEYAEVMKGNRPDKKKWPNGKMPKERLIKLYRELCSDPDYRQEALYVYNIISLYENLLIMSPESYEYVHKAYFQQWDSVLWGKIKYDGKEKQFYEHVISCMGYADVRSDILREYIKDQHIKACVYCNAQYAVTTEEFEVEKGRKIRIGTYQFDHLWPESKFPFLCTTYFNLQPSCPTCNQAKLKRTAAFNLYTDQEKELDVFRFELTPDKAVMSYLADDMDELEVKLCSDNKELLKNHQELFHIDSIYAEHIDVVQRIILIMQANSPYYREALQTALDSLFPLGVDDPQFFFFGYYLKKENIHLQPLSKLVQDVVNEINHTYIEH